MKSAKTSQLLFKTVAGNNTILPFGQVLQVFGICYNETLLDQMLILKAIGQSNNGIFLQEEHLNSFYFRVLKKLPIFAFSSIHEDEFP